ncbi:hydroxysteroid dehydrogenase-like protein 1 [Trichonephila clavipes]|nr:hydroxysteroid dehydrogenase-like protein 1 [Trichonephila clavipes]
MFFGVSNSRLPLLKPITFPGHLRYDSVNLDLVLPVQKYNSLMAELRYAALATVPERYPDQDWLHVFTDGSATASFGMAGVGAFLNFFNLKEPLSA